MLTKQIVRLMSEQDCILHSESKPTIVIVDDEEILLKSISLLLCLETNYHVRTFMSVTEALDFIEHHETDLVISDYVMPLMDGIAFLSRVKEIKPEIPRIILTSVADRNVTIRAIREVGLFQYITRPIDNDDLLIIVRNALERQSLVKNMQEQVSRMKTACHETEELQNEIIKVFV